MNLEAFILVGGRSSRFGRDKALERLGGATLAELALDSVRDSKIFRKATFISGNGVEFAGEAARLEAPVVSDAIDGRGPLGALHAALENTTSKWVFLLACDLPFISPGLIVRLSDFLDQAYGAVIPIQPGGRLQPLCGFYQVAKASPVVSAIVRNIPTPPMHAIVRSLGPRIVIPTEYEPNCLTTDHFLNINTQKDLQKAKEIAQDLHAGRHG